MGKRTSWSALCAIISKVAPNLDTAIFVCLSASLNREYRGRINQQHLLNLFNLQKKQTLECGGSFICSGLFKVTDSVWNSKYPVLGSEGYDA